MTNQNAGPNNKPPRRDAACHRPEVRPVVLANLDPKAGPIGVSTRCGVVKGIGPSIKCVVADTTRMNTLVEYPSTLQKLAELVGVSSPSELTEAELKVWRLCLLDGIGAGS